MATREIFRYSWIKVSDEDGRAETMRAALEVQHSLLERTGKAPAGSEEARFLRTQTLMARAYLGGEVEHGIRVVIFTPAEGGSLSLDLLTPLPHAIARDGVEITTAAMPSGYTRADALAWLATPVGLAWSKGALACRLAQAVVTAEVSDSAPASTEEAVQPHA